MRLKNLSVFLGFVVIFFLLTACGASPESEPTPDVAAVRTSAATTVEARFTLTAAAFTPTPLPASETPSPEPTETAIEAAIGINEEGTPVELCDKYSWDVNTVDVNIQDGTVLSPGQDFTKTWLIRNTGNCTWGEGYNLIFSYGDIMSGEAIPFTTAILPGEEVEVSVNFIAPAEIGTYISFWTLQNPSGIAFLGNDDKALYVQIIVE